jgi:allantoinase
MPPQYDTLVENVRVVRPGTDSVVDRDVAITDDTFAAVETEIPRSDADTVFDADGLMAFPGAVDAHTHVGIYQHPSEDAPTETAAAVTGGVTTMLDYVRTGSLYLDRPGPVEDFFEELLRECRGQFHTDYGFNVSPIQGAQIDEMEYLLTEQGCPNYGEVFMFYGIHGLHGTSDEQHEWLMLDEGDNYDLAHFDFVCREAARLQEEYPDLAEEIAVSFHCETPELLREYEHKVREEGDLEGLEAYSAARPPHSEAIAISMVGEMAHQAGLSEVNVLHITSKAAVDAAMRAEEAYPDVNFGLETTAGHLLLDYERAPEPWSKVNPPLRSPADREYLWDRIEDGTLEWVITDNANCPRDAKADPDDPEAIWNAKAGFGGSEFLLPGIFSEATSRGLSPNRVAELVSGKPARRFGLHRKGDVAEGYDADLVLLDPDETWTASAEDSLSNQGYSPFEGLEVTGRVKHTFLRGDRVYEDGDGVADPRGEFLKRPYGSAD